MLLVQWFSSARTLECNIDLNEPLVKDFQVKFQDMHPFGSWQEGRWLERCWRLGRIRVKCWGIVLDLLLVSISVASVEMFRSILFVRTQQGPRHICPYLRVVVVVPETRNARES